MDTKTFARSTSQNLTILVFIILSISSIATCLHEATPDVYPADDKTENYRIYIAEACKETTYNEVCLESLTPLAIDIAGNETTLCETSLKIVLKAAVDVSKSLKVAGANECVAKTNDSMEYINDSIKALQLLRKGVKKEFQKSNIQTWMSSVITSCAECKGQGEEAQSMEYKASNALFFINKLKV